MHSCSAKENGVRSRRRTEGEEGERGQRRSEEHGVRSSFVAWPRATELPSTAVLDTTKLDLTLRFVPFAPGQIGIIENGQPLLGNCPQSYGFRVVELPVPVH